jgi:DegV family protein with EDD domain
MSNIQIITDSMTDVPKALAEKYSIIVLPLTIHFENEEYRDGVDLSYQEFYNRLSVVKELPKTSQIPPGVFKEVFEKLLSEGKEIICINGSSRASGTHQSAIIAKQDLESELIDVVDTLGLSMGAGLAVIEAAKMVKEGIDRRTIVERLIACQDKVEHIFTVDTLEFLKKGGRINPMKALIGGMLNVKPILTVREGLVESLDKVRGSKKVIHKMVELAKERGGDFSGKTVAIAHANSPENLIQLREAVMSELRPKEIIETDVGCTIGTHAGPGTLALFYFKE